MFTSITDRFEQQPLFGGHGVPGMRPVSSWYRTKANLGTRWRT